MRRTRAEAREKYRSIVPALLAIILEIFLVINLQALGLKQIAPLFMVMFVYYWAIYSPEVLPRWSIFMLGMVHDVLNGGVMGFSALMLLILWGMMVPQRKYLLKEPFMVVWLVVVVPVGIYGTAEWVMYMLLQGEIKMDSTVWIRQLVSVMVYPCVHKVLNNVHRYCYGTAL
jgi:rod shape-determining protein MreD